MASTDNRVSPTPVAVIAATSVVVLQVDHIVYNRLRGIYGGAADHGIFGLRGQAPADDKRRAPMLATWR